MNRRLSIFRQCLGVYLLVAAPLASACKCPDRTLSESVALAESVFVGLVVEARDLAPAGLESFRSSSGSDDDEPVLGVDYGIKLRFRVVIAGSDSQFGTYVESFHDYHPFDHCGPELAVGRAYLVLVSADGTLMTCSATREVVVQTCDDVRELEALVMRRSPEATGLGSVGKPLASTDFLVQALKGHDPVVALCGPVP